MKICMITFRSVTPAQRGEQLLRRAGLTCTLHRTPRRMEEQGCGYSLRLQSNEFSAALARLRENRAEYRKAYCLDETGRWEELRL